MSLNAALVDRARRVVNTPSGQRVEGTTLFEEYHYPWFKCRLTLEAAPSTADAQGGRQRTPHPAQMMCGLKDQDGNLLAINASDTLEVNSKELGRALYQVTSDGEPIRKKRKMLGWTATLTRVEEHPFDRPEP
jgi:hypothetical protein